MGFYKFPRTPHLLWLGEGGPRDDKLLGAAAAAEFLAGPIIVEEKVDGANLGISLADDGVLRAQNRGQQLREREGAPQWNPLWPWLAAHREALAAGLQGGLVLFGEWCFARHSVAYDELPDWFLGFDIYDPAHAEFWSVDRRDAWLSGHGFAAVPAIVRGQFNLGGLAALIGRSALGHTPMEGIYLRRERQGQLEARAKVVSAAFHQQMGEHWARRRLVPNRLGPPSLV